MKYDVPAWAIYGVLLLLLMYFLPSGIMGGVASLRQRFGNRETNRMNVVTGKVARSGKTARETTPAA